MVLIESDWNLKEEREDELLAKDWVLIESDWNLKTVFAAEPIFVESVLIESDWNLKIRRYVINRRCILHVLIESDWNLKQIQASMDRLEGAPY